MKIIICNAFSLSMLDRDTQKLKGPGIANGLPVTPRQPMPVDDPMAIIAAADEVVSAVGHADVAAIMAQLLKIDVPVNRTSIKLAEGTRALIGQYMGPRLPEGETSLPAGSTIEWWIV